MNADGWRRLLVSKNFGREGVELRREVAYFAKKLCVVELAESLSIQPYVACRLIPLNKNPGIRPIGIGEVLRRIV